jgi:hypothetical protein
MAPGQRFERDLVAPPFDDNDLHMLGLTRLEAPRAASPERQSG